MACQTEIVRCHSLFFCLTVSCLLALCTTLRRKRQWRRVRDVLARALGSATQDITRHREAPCQEQCL